MSVFVAVSHFHTSLIFPHIHAIRLYLAGKYQTRVKVVWATNIFVHNTAVLIIYLKKFYRTFRCWRQKNFHWSLFNCMFDGEEINKTDSDRFFTISSEIVIGFGRIKLQSLSLRVDQNKLECWSQTSCFRSALYLRHLLPNWLNQKC